MHALQSVCNRHLGCCAQVPLLLRDIHIEMRTLGAELLAVFTRVQSPVDSKLDAIQAHVPQVRTQQNVLSIPEGMPGACYSTPSRFRQQRVRSVLCMLR